MWSNPNVTLTEPTIRTVMRKGDEAVSQIKSMRRLHETLVIAAGLQADVCKHASATVGTSLERVYRGGRWLKSQEARVLLRPLTEDFINDVLHIIEQHGLWLSGEVGRTLLGSAGDSCSTPILPF